VVTTLSPVYDTEENNFSPRISVGHGLPGSRSTLRDGRPRTCVTSTTGSLGPLSASCITADYGGQDTDGSDPYLNWVALHCLWLIISNKNLWSELFHLFSMQLSGLYRTLDAKGAVNKHLTNINTCVCACT